MGAIIVTGLPGVGKTTVMKKAAEGLDFQFITFGTAMFEEAKAKGLVEHRDETRTLSASQQLDLQMKAAETIAKTANAIVDTHCTIKTPQGYLPGLPEAVLKKLKPSTIVVVEADPEEIYNRRVSDTTRNRDSDTVAAITEHQQINRSAAVAYSALTGATVKIVQNHDDRLDEAVECVKPVIS